MRADVIEELIVKLSSVSAILGALDAICEVQDYIGQIIDDLRAAIE